MNPYARYNHDAAATSGDRMREWGHVGPWVIVLHGGPAARGTAAPIARALSDRYRVLEPWQRRSGEEPLTVARHVEDLDELISSRCRPERPALVGTSWGAMLALAYAAAHPDRVGPLVLVGCGTFDPAARRLLERRVRERTDERLQRRLERLDREAPDDDTRVRERMRLTHHIYAFDPIEGDPTDDLVDAFDQKGHEESWADMLRLQERSVYPATFEHIVTPVVMLHGAYDPHPGDRTRDTLRPHLPQLEYREWEQCGHEPWREKQVREVFFATLHDWLASRL